MTQYPTSIPATHRDLLDGDTRAYAYLATIMADGSPQVTPIWFNSEGGFILFNSAEGRVKDRNMRARPRVALLVADPGDPLRYLQVRGRIVEYTEEGAIEHINILSMKYRGKPWTPVTGQTRVTYKLRLEHVSIG